MIKINLALKKQVQQASRNAMSGGLLAKIRLEDLNGFSIKRLVIPIVAMLTLSYVYSDYQDKELTALDEAIGKLNNLLDESKKELEKVNKYDEIKKQLDGDELTIKTKLDTIQKLLKNKNDGLNLMTTISKRIPDSVWLNEIVLRDTDVKLSGGSLEYNEVLDFMKNLNLNSTFSEVNLNSTKKNEDKELDGEVVSYELDIKRRQ